MKLDAGAKNVLKLIKREISKKTDGRALAQCYLAFYLKKCQVS